MTGSASQRRRRGAAVLCALLWLLGVELVPALHLAHHHADHTHAADGSIVADHDGADHHNEPDYDHTGKLVMDHPPHEAAGLAHHAAALHRSPPPLVACAPVRVPQLDPALVIAPLASIAPPRSTARGPPGIRVLAS